MESPKKNGAVTTTMVLGFAITLLLSMGGAIYASAINTTSQVQSRTEDLQKANLDAVQRVSKLEEAVSTIKGDTAEIRGDIKSLLQEVRKK